MKRIFNLLIITVFAVSLFTIFSCSEDFLTKQPSGVAAGTVMQTSEGVERLLIGVYERMAGDGIFGGAMGTDWTWGGGASDDCYKGTSSGDQSAYNDVERYEVLPSNPYLRERWRDCYNGVARANVCLTFLWETQAGANPIPAARASEIEAELKFLRAWFHFSANRVFEKIPYIKTPTELGDTKPEEVANTDPGWDGIEADLQYAIDNLPTTKINGEVGRADKYAAMAVKAHAHMHQGEFALAKTLLDAIIATNKYSLVSNFYDNYDMTHENNAESIFELQAATSPTSYSSIMPTGSSYHQQGAASNGGWGFYQPSKNLFEAFQVDANGLPVLDVAARDPLPTDMGIGSGANFVQTDHLLDPRVDWTIARRGIDFLGWGIHPGNDWIREQSNGGPMMTKKYMHKLSEKSLNTNGSGFRNGKNYRQYRYAHILLWRAEIAVEDNDLPLARNLVNQIRDRAKTSDVVMGLCTSYSNLTSNPTVDWGQPAANYLVEPYPAGGVYPFDTQANARKAVREELRLEFATEGFRFFDLRRWGIADQVLNAYIAQDATFRTFLTGAHYNPTEDDYWPLPQDQLDLQKGVLTQDPAYGK
jgi:hypothetical protein